MTVVIDTSTNFIAANIVTTADVYYSESDTGQLKVGVASTHWLDLPHVGDPLVAVVALTAASDPDVNGGTA